MSIVSAKKVDCFMGKPIEDIFDDMVPDDFKWKPLGSIDFYKDKNEEKTLFLDIDTQFIQLAVSKPFEKGKTNEIKQVGSRDGSCSVMIRQYIYIFIGWFKDGQSYWN